jgi:hypothetical protein
MLLLAAAVAEQLPWQPLLLVMPVKKIRTHDILKSSFDYC